MPEPDAGLVGRSEELDQLRNAMSDALRGVSRITLVIGEPGIGKSSLLAAVADEARAHGFVVRSGRAEELRRDRPFGAISDALGLIDDGQVSASGEPGALSASSGAAVEDFTAAPAARHRIVNKIVAAVSAATSTQPMVILLDDLQWADFSTVLAIHELNERLPNARLLIVGACRPVPRSDELRRLFSSGRPDSVIHLRLRPLAADDIAELTARLVGHEPGALLLAGVARIGGNPFYLHELISALKVENRLVVRDGTVDVTDGQLPRSLRSTIIRRLAFLPEDSISCLRWAAVLGSSFAVDDLAIVTNATVSRTVSLLEPLMAAEVLVAREERLAFAHDLVHEVVYGDIPEGMRLAMHLGAASDLAAAGRPAIEVAPHFSRGARGHNLGAAEWLTRAGRDIAPRAPQSAVELFTRAYSLTAPGDEPRTSLSLDLVRALLWAGRWSEAEQHARDSLHGERDGRLIGLLGYVLGRALVYRARTVDSIDETERAFESQGVPLVERMNLEADLAIRLPLAGHIERAEAAARHVISEPQSSRLAQRTAQDALSIAALLRGAPADAVAFAREALAAHEHRVGEAVELLQPDFYYSIALTPADEFDEALIVLDRLRRRTDDMSLTWASGLAGILIGQIQYLRGNWDSALDSITVGLGKCAESGTRVWSLLAWSVLATIHYRRGDHRAASVAMGNANELVKETGRAHLAFDRWLLARVIAEPDGDADRLAAAIDAWDEIMVRGFVGSRQLLGPPLVRLARRVGRQDLVRTVAVAMESLARPGTPTSYQAAVMSVRAQADSDPGLAIEAAGAYCNVGRLVESAEAFEDAGTLFVAQGRVEDARAALSEALKVYDGIGADLDVARVEQAQRAIGVRRGAAGSRGRPSTGWPSLTATEREVVVLAADGLTNREIASRLFVSHRTVATHLSNVMAKVGKNSRVELAAAVAGGALEDGVA